MSTSQPRRAKTTAASTAGSFAEKPQTAPEVALGGQHAIPDEGDYFNISSEGWPAPPEMKWAPQPLARSLEGYGIDAATVTARLSFSAPEGFDAQADRVLTEVALAVRGDTEIDMDDGVVSIDIDHHFDLDGFTPAAAAAAFSEVADNIAQVLAAAGYPQFSPRT